MDVMTDHYGVRSQFEAWVVGLVVGRVARKYGVGGLRTGPSIPARRRRRPGRLPPGGLVALSLPRGHRLVGLDDAKIFAVIAHVGRDDPYARSGWGMLPTWWLAQGVWGAVDDWAQVARMSRTQVAWHLNPITAHLMGKLFR